MPIYPYDMGRSHLSWFLSCISVLKRLRLFCNLLRDLQLNPLPAAKSDDATTSFFLCLFWFGKNILLRVIPTMTFIDLLLANLLAFYLTYLLAFDLALYLANLLAFYLTYLLAFDLALYLANLLAFSLAYLLAFYLAYHLAFSLAYLLAFFLAYLMAFYLAYLLAFYLTLYLAYLLAFYLAVEVQRCTLSWAGPRLRSSSAR